MKKYSFAVLFMVLAVTLSSCSKEKIDSSSNDNQQLLNDSTISEVLEIDTEKKDLTDEKAYEPLLEKYSNALENNPNADEFMENDLNYMVADLSKYKSIDSIGYTMIDLNNDGILELIIGSITDDQFFKNMIFDLYTLDKTGEAKLVFQGGERNRYYSLADNKFANVGSSGADDSFDTTLKFENNEMVDMSYTTESSDYIQLELIPINEFKK